MFGQSQSQPPSKHTAVHLIKGSEVEVSSNEQGLRGAWYRGTVIETPPRTKLRKRKKALIHYTSLLADDGSSPLTEYVDPAHIRPLPPADGDDCVYSENDIVDASDRDGWWTGIVRKVLEGSRYRVYFDNPPDVIEFDAKDLRFSLEWRKGSWVRPEKSQASESNFSSGTTVEVLLDEEELNDIWFPAIVVKECANNSFLVKYSTSTNDDEVGGAKVTVDSRHIRPAPPHFVNRSFELLEKVDAVYSGGWRAGVITKVLTAGRYGVFFKQGNEDKEFSQSELRPHVDWTGDKKVGTNKQGNDRQVKMPAIETNNVEEQTPFTMKLRKTLSRQPTSSKENPTSLAPSPRNKRIKSIPSNGSGVPSRFSNTLSEGNAAIQPLSIQSDQSCVSSQSPFFRPEMMIKRENSEDHIQTMDLEKSKRISGTLQDKTVQEFINEIPAADGQKMEIDRSPVADVDPLEPTEDLKQKENLDNIAEVNSRQINQQKDGSSQRRTRGRPRKISLIAVAGKKSSGSDGVVSNIKAMDRSNVEVNAVTGADPSDCEATRVGTAVTENSDHQMADDDDRPLSTWVGGVLTSSNPEELRPYGRTLSLPFMKECSVWKVIESLEAFKIIPQNPHFSPLAELNEAVREGTAIGKMVIFSNLFERIPKLQIGDPKSVFDSILESLIGLEKHGFDVNELKRRTSDLLNMKMAKEQFESELFHTDRMIIKHSGEKEKFELQMDEIKKKIADLHELHDAIKLKKDEEENEVVRQRAEIKSLHERIQEAESKFAKATIAPWKLP